MTFVIMTFDIMTFVIMTFVIMTFVIMTFVVMTFVMIINFVIMTFVIMDFVTNKKSVFSDVVPKVETSKEVGLRVMNNSNGVSSRFSKSRDKWHKVFKDRAWTCDKRHTVKSFYLFGRSTP